MMKKLLLLIILICLFIGCSSSEKAIDENDGVSSFTKESLEEYLTTISSDEFMGRKPFTEGEIKTIEFLQTTLKNLGLEPGNGSSYLQEVPLVSVTSQADSVMTIQGSKTKFNLRGYHDYVIWSQQKEGVSVKEDEIVFAGYGIIAPEYNWNDYEGLDVKGKIVLVFVNDPGFGLGDSTFFKGNNMTYYGRWTYKFEEAARQGAKGCLVIHDDVPASYPFAVPQISWNSAKLYLDQQGTAVNSCAVEGWISMPAARKLFDTAGLDYAQHLAAAHKVGFRGLSMNLRMTTNILTRAYVQNKSYNVVAKITGSERPDEYVIYSAHWDHLGIGKADAEGDSIYNGALDNGSGTAGLIEIAKAFTSLKTKPARTVVFLFVTAEEQGLLGSAYYATNPIFAPAQSVANINIDGINGYGKMKDISIIGMGQSDLEDYLSAACGKVNRYTTPDPEPAAGYYFRSDHFHFAKIGIPALYTHNGIDHVEKGKRFGEEKNREYRTKNYHKPSDEYDPTRWDLEGSLDDLKLLFAVGRRLSLESTWPSWKEGSEFKSIREQYQKKK